MYLTIKNFLGYNYSGSLRASFGEFHSVTRMIEKNRYVTFED